jgi:inner membrane protein
MTGAALGIAAAWSMSPSPVALVTGAVVGGFSGILPDIDYPGSMAGKLFRPVAVWLEEKSRHRESLTHTVWFCAVTGYIAGYIGELLTGAQGLIVAGLLGSLSHLVLDGMTRSGVRPFKINLPKFAINSRHGKDAKGVGETWNRFAERVGYLTCWRIRGSLYTGQSMAEPVIEFLALAAALTLGLCAFLK